LKRRIVAFFLAPAMSTLVLSAMSACDNGSEERLSRLGASGASRMASASTSAAGEALGSAESPSTPDRAVEGSSGGTQDEMVGDFCFPRNVPEYGVISAVEGGNELMTVLELVVDSEVTSEIDLTLIARDLKVSYFYFDSLLVSFVDRSKPGAPETGEAQIINTVSGALILGMSDGPPNREGLTVISYGDPASIDEDEVFARTVCS
jgi:hypothetical protein